MPNLGPMLMLVAVLMFGGSSGAAQVATPDPTSLPEVPAPFGIEADHLPASREAIETRFAHLPETIAGERQQPWVVGSDRIQVFWGDADDLGHPMQLGAIAFAEGDFFPPGFTAGDYVAMSLGTDEFAHMTGGRDGDVAWLLAEISIGVSGERPGTPAAQRTMSTLAWGVVDGGWVFTAMADTPERLEALVVAFVTTGQAGNATPTGAWNPAAFCGPIVQTDCTITQ